MKRITPSISFIIGFLIAYFIYRPVPSFVEKLEGLGITRSSISKMVFIGDDSSLTAGKKYYLTNNDDIAWIWDKVFKNAKPYSHIELSGNRIIEIYTHDSTNKAVAKLYVNGTNATSIENEEQRYMCIGLEAIILRLLRKNGPS